jgi:hypothetical protein
MSASSPGLCTTPPLVLAGYALSADAWADRTVHALFPAGGIPTRDVIDAAMAASIPPIGTPAVIHWSGRRNGEPPWRGLVAGQYPGGFTIRVHPGRYVRFVSYVDLWCRHAEMDEPPVSTARIKAIRHILHARMPSARHTGD